jgi:hypothetical protein
MVLDTAYCDDLVQRALTSQGSKTKGRPQTRLMVPSAFAQRARELLDELDLNVGQINLTHAQSDEEDDINGEDAVPPMESGPLESAADEARDPRRPLGLSMEAAIILFIIAAILVFYWLY